MSMSGDSKEPREEQSQAPLIEHLIELRSRLMRAVIVILVVFLGLYAFANDIYTFVAEPLMALLPEGSQMIATEVASPFLAPFKLTLVVAVFIAIPFVLHQPGRLSRLGFTTMKKHWRYRSWCRALRCSTAARRLPTTWFSRCYLSSSPKPGRRTSLS